MTQVTRSKRDIVAIERMVTALPKRLHERARKFVEAFYSSDLEHADHMLDWAHKLNVTPQGRAFVAAFVVENEGEAAPQQTNN